MVHELLVRLRKIWNFFNLALIVGSAQKSASNQVGFLEHPTLHSSSFDLLTNCVSKDKSKWLVQMKIKIKMTNTCIFANPNLKYNYLTISVKLCKSQRKSEQQTKKHKQATHFPQFPILLSKYGNREKTSVLMLWVSSRNTKCIFSWVFRITHKTKFVTRIF